MSQLLNEWIGYVERGYEQMMQAIIDRMPTYVPEITDRSDSNPWIKSARIFAGLAEQLGYYLDARARETFLPTARNYASAVRFAALVDYRIRGTLPASVDLVFSVQRPEASATFIPAGTQVKTVGGLAFITLNDAYLPAGATQVTVAAQNWQLVQGAALGTSDGSENQRFALAAGVVDNNITVLVGASPVAWEPVDTFAFSAATATVFRASQNEQQVLEAQFGDGVSGQVPGAGLAITATYYTSQGAAGNVAGGTLTEVAGLVSPGGQTLAVTNPGRASGGADAEGLEVLRKRIPLSLRTLDRAVSRQDYIDVALLAPGVAQAGVVYDCGKVVDVYVAPTGGGVASSALLASTEAYFDSRQMLTTDVVAHAAGEVQLRLTVHLKVRPNYYRAATLAAARANALAFLSVANQEINGALELGDVYQTFEDTDGVQFSRVLLLSTIPYARPLASEPALDWVVEVQPDSQKTLVWQLIFNANGQYSVIRDNAYVADYAVGQQVVLDEVEFTVNTQYPSGSSWEFVTYGYNGSIQLAEQSVLVLDPVNFTITAEGGLV